ncbi:MAG: TetR family transcriptional regulator [Myxococcales bacterium]|nr:TetR family transcriptional regulator [Myxococcales bacterium]
MVSAEFKEAPLTSPDRSTRARIATSARRVVARDGVGNLTLDRVAEEVGITKQAVLYHYGSRSGLLGEVYLNELAAESETLCRAAAEAEPGVPAVRAALRAVVAWHLEDLDRFRLTYAANQLARVPEQIDAATRDARVYPVTGRMHSTLEHNLRASPQLPAELDARKLAVAIHALAIGIGCYAGMLDAVGETLAHDWHQVADTLIDALAAGIA